MFRLHGDNKRSPAPLGLTSVEILINCAQYVILVNSEQNLLFESKRGKLYILQHVQEKMPVYINYTLHTNPKTIIRKDFDFSFRASVTILVSMIR